MKPLSVTLLLVIALAGCKPARPQEKKQAEGFITVREVQTSSGGGVYVIWADVELNARRVSPGDAIVFACLSQTVTCKKPLVHTQLHLVQLPDDDPQAYKRGTEFSISGTGIGHGKPGVGRTEESYIISSPDGSKAVYFLADYQPDTAASAAQSEGTGSTLRKPDRGVAKSDFQILAMRKHFLAPNMFSPVLTVLNKSSHDLWVYVAWYATDEGVDVARGSCSAVSVRPGTKAEVDCDPPIMDHPSAKIKLGEPELRVN